MAALTAPPRYFDRGNGARLLQPANQSALLTTLPTTATTGNIEVMGNRINQIIASLQAAGIMKTS